jgi:hypothetical protein
MLILIAIVLIYFIGDSMADSFFEAVSNRLAPRGRTTLDAQRMMGA